MYKLLLLLVALVIFAGCPHPPPEYPPLSESVNHSESGTPGTPLASMDCFNLS